MKALVTGATGFVGGWLTRALIREGLDVRVLIRQDNELDDLSDLKIESVKGDISDAAAVQQACKGVDSVFHLAGVVAYSSAQRQLMEKVNVQGTQNIVDACKSQSVRRLVHFSSVVAIGASLDGKNSAQRRVAI